MPINERVIFDAAVEIPDPEARLAFVEKACEGDAELQARVLSLLKSHTDAGSFLEIPAAAPLGKAVAEITEKTIVGVPMGNDEDDSDDESNRIDLSFLQPSAKAGSIGTLGHYEILKVLGQGGFGVVFKAFDEKLHRHVAIKVMNPQMAATSPPRKRFLREARSAAAIRHENIVAVHSVEEQPLPYLVMEFIDGQTLQQKLDGSGPLDVTEILYLGQQIASGLAAAHALSLIHRDIKPGNILIEGDVEQKVKITDFGLARAADDASLTRSGMISGTPMYMAPEQATGQALDHRTDLFSLGSVLYQMGCGRPPFRAPNTVAVLRRVAEDTPRALQEIVPELPDWLVVIINKLLAKKPEDRYQSAKEVAELLGKCRSELQLTGRVACVATDRAESVPGRSTPSADVPTTPVYTPGDEWKNVPDGQRRFWKYLVPLIVFVVCLPVVTQLVKLPQPFTGFLMILALFLIGLPFLIHRARQRQVPAKTATQPSLRRVLYFMMLGMMIMFPILFGRHLSSYVNAWMWPAIPVLYTTNTASGLEFDGKDDFVSIEAVDWSYPQFTIEAFVTSVADSDNGTIVQLGSGGDKPEWMSLYDDHQADPGKRLSGAAIQGKTPFANTSAPLTPGVRQHRVLVFDGRYMHYYVNGIWQAKRFAEAHEGLMWKMKVLRIGCDGSERRFFQGRIDQVRISRVARYNDNFASLTSVASDDSTLALYNFDERTGEVLKDASGNGHDGKIIGATWVNSKSADLTFNPNLPPSEISNSKSQISHSSTGWHGWPSNAPAPAIAPFDAAQSKQHQEEWARYLKVPVEYTNSIGMKFRLIPPGEFTRGSTNEEIEEAIKEVGEDKHWHDCIRSEAPQHKVILTLPVYLGVHEVTQAEYEKVMGTNPSHFAPLGAGKAAIAGLDTTSHPVETVDWHDAAEFCAKLSDEERLKPFSLREGDNTRALMDGTGYQLPTEAEWEFACRAGTTTRFWIGEKDEDVRSVGWFEAVSGGRTHAVGELRRNPFGMFDMNGNVWEWMQDWWGPTYYEQFHEESALDPRGPSPTDFHRVIRGGYLNDPAIFLRSSFRVPYSPKTRGLNLGFRVSLQVDAVRQALKLTGPAMPKSMATTPSAPAPDTIDFAAERQAAEWVLANKGTMSIAVSPNWEWRDYGATDGAMPLPSEPFVITALHMTNSQVKTESDLERLTRCRYLENLTIVGGTIESSAMDLLTRLPRLKTLSLTDQKNLRTSALPKLGRISTLDYLGITSEMVDDRLEFVRHLPTLRSLKIWGPQPPDIDLLAEAPQLRTILLTTPDAVDDAKLVAVQSRNDKLRIVVGWKGKYRTVGRDPTHEAAKQLVELGVECLVGVNYWQAPTKLLTKVDFENGGVWSFSVQKIPASVQLSADDREKLKLLDSYHFVAEGQRDADELARCLSQNHGIATITMTNCDLTDAGLEHLQQLVSLRNVNVSNTKVTQVGIERFRRTVPFCWITSDFGVIQPQFMSADAAQPKIDGNPTSWPAEAPVPAIAPFNAEQARQHQAAWAKHLGIPAEFTDRHGTKYVLIPPGEFQMGFSQTEFDTLTRELKQAGASEYDLFSASTSAPKHTVRITKPFYMSAHEVTVAEYRKFIDETHYMTTAEQLGGLRKKWSEYLAPENPDRHPVMGVSWTDAETYCVRRSEQDGVTYRMPSEAEWEYACRAGTTTLWSFGDNPAQIVENAVTTPEGTSTQPVGSRKPNPLGLFDMYGNADEWCLDWHTQDFYATCPTDDPVNLKTPTDINSGRVARGCGTISLPWQLRSSTRRWDFPSTPVNLKGFRVVITGDLKKAATNLVTTGWHGWPSDAPAPAIAPFNAEQARQLQEAWAKYLNVPVEYTNSIGMKFVLIPPGEFMMGSSPEEIAQALGSAGDDKLWQETINSEGPQHKVVLTKATYVGVHEVTQGQFEQVMGRNPSRFGPMGASKDLIADLDTSNFPVEKVSWDEATRFCMKLSEVQALADGKAYRLLTDAEWEFACRAGTTTEYWIGENEQERLQTAWLYENSSERTHVVGELKGNPFGLYDVHGNVWEWVQDAWDPTFYGQPQGHLAVDPIKPSIAGAPHVTRGGCWSSSIASSRSASRSPETAAYSGTLIGFRVSLAVEAVRETLKSTP